MVYQWNIGGIPVNISGITSGFQWYISGNPLKFVSINSGIPWHAVLVVYHKWYTSRIPVVITSGNQQ